MFSEIAMHCFRDNIDQAGSQLDITCAEIKFEIRDDATVMG